MSCLEDKATLPGGPGPGVKIDESMFAKLNTDPRRKFKWPTPTLPDGAVRDYREGVLLLVSGKRCRSFPNLI